jgi:hypothetical protein
MGDKIMTVHPQGKQGVNIDRDKYDTVRAAILDILAQRGEMTFRELDAAVDERLAGKFDGAVGWYFTTVKLDMEARGEIERLPGSQPQLLRRIMSGES